ncbi:MAG: dihydrofolate reductase [Comamonas sp. SCN 65-56]|uniref:dihydrofolate reductase n=1 Tax=Comamonas sp. SCN 65-56 TaxID=1660095 RepID=UPI000869B8BC|nr:dihydrofolate reductase [Comamonas sp. SCN 65-56]ODS92923.1 MAG: dihydrofolate reductase [Comamonas sp. SCN 65-56]
MEIALIYARAANGVIGQGGSMPWHLPEDLAHFKALTQGQPVIMGRKTWDSLPSRFRPLPGRLNIVITRQENWSENGTQRATSLREALSTAEQSGASTAWVIGGAQIFAEALPLATRAEVTEIAQEFEGDTWAPALGSEWRLTAHSDHVSAQGLGLRFARYERLA